MNEHVFFQRYRLFISVFFAISEAERIQSAQISELKFTFSATFVRYIFYVFAMSFAQRAYRYVPFEGKVHCPAVLRSIISACMYVDISLKLSFSE